MYNTIIKITGLLLLVQLIGCATPNPSPEANTLLVGEALMTESDNKVAKLYILVEDSRVAFTNLKFEVNNVLAGEIGEDQYLYLKFDEGYYKIVSEVSHAVVSVSEKGENNYLAKPGSIDILSCPLTHFYLEDLPCQIRPFKADDVAKLKEMVLRAGDVSHFGSKHQSKLPDYEFYKKAKQKNTIAAYQKYLKNYPNGEYKKAAQRGIKILKWEE